MFGCVTSDFGRGSSGSTAAVSRTDKLHLGKNRSLRAEGLQREQEALPYSAGFAYVYAGFNGEVARK